MFVSHFPNCMSTIGARKIVDFHAFSLIIEAEGCQTRDRHRPIDSRRPF